MRHEWQAVSPVEECCLSKGCSDGQQENNLTIRITVPGYFAE